MEAGMVAWGESGHGTEVKALMELGDGHEKKNQQKHKTRRNSISILVRRGKGEREK